MSDKNTVGAAIALIYTAGFFVVLASLFYSTVPASNEKYVLLMIGYMVGAAGTAVSFYLGSSLGSSKKDDAIANLAPTKADTTTTTTITTDTASPKV